MIKENNVMTEENESEGPNFYWSLFGSVTSSTASRDTLVLAATLFLASAKLWRVE
jgi:hypothetical protein